MKRQIVIAGNHQKWQDEIEARCKKVGEYYHSPSLCDIQVEQSGRGRRQAEMGLSMYGWTLRYASGLQGFEIIFSSKDKNPAKCLAWSLDWVSVNPDNRSLTVSLYDIERAEKSGIDCSVLRAYQNENVAGA